VQFKSLRRWRAPQDWSLCSHTIHTDPHNPSYAADAGWRRAQWRAASTRGPPKSPPITRFLTAVAERLVEHTQAPSRPSRLPQNVPHTRSKYGPRRSPPALALAQHLKSSSGPCLVVAHGAARSPSPQKPSSGLSRLLGPRIARDRRTRRTKTLEYPTRPAPAAIPPRRGAKLPIAPNPIGPLLKTALPPRCKLV
jgi:hypothetical protein